MKCKWCGKNGHEVDQCWASWESIKGIHNQNKEDKNKNCEAGKSPDSTHCIVSQCNICINEINSLSYYKDCWLLDTSATSHMTFRKECFE